MTTNIDLPSKVSATDYYRYRKLAAQNLKKSFNETGYIDHAKLSSAILNGVLIDRADFRAVKYLAERYGKPIPEHKLSSVEFSLSRHYAH